MRSSSPSYTGMREKPLSIKLFVTSVKEAWASRAWISVRGIMTAFTGVSANSKTLWISSFSVSLKIPLAAPSRISDLTSSTVMKLAPSFSLPPKSQSTALLEAVSDLTKNEVMRERKSIGRATIRAICSGNRRARDLGTNSPNTKER